MPRLGLVVLLVVQTLVNIGITAVVWTVHKRNAEMCDLIDRLMTDMDDPDPPETSDYYGKELRGRL